MKLIKHTDTVLLSGAPYFAFDQNKNTLFIKQIPKNISRRELKDLFATIDGIQYFSLSEPNKQKDFSR